MYIHTPCVRAWCVFWLREVCRGQENVCREVQVCGCWKVGVKTMGMFVGLCVRWWHQQGLVGMGQRLAVCVLEQKLA